MKGGKDGPALVPGNVKESELIKRLLLPREDKHHMPPKLKPQLNERQIALIHWWVENGADFTRKVKDIPKPEKIQPVLLSLQSDHLEKKADPIIPAGTVDKGDQKAIDALKERGIVILPVAQNSNYLVANFITATGVTDKDIRLLLPLKNQLVWLKLGHTNITDSALSIIGQFRNLTLLQLNNTGITDKGLGLLKSLNNLQFISLVGTKVTRAGVLQLTPLKKLQSIYLYQTAITGKEWAVLKKMFPKTMLDTGGYRIPFLAMDTVIAKPPVKAK
jgi:hypothetical protein